MFNEKFVELLKNYPDAVHLRKKLVALLKDIFPREAKRTRLLINLHELLIADEIEKADMIDDRFAFRYVKRLVEDFGVGEPNAIWAVCVWCTCYGEGILGKSCRINIVEDTFAYADDYTNNEFDFPGNENEFNTWTTEVTSSISVGNAVLRDGISGVTNITATELDESGNEPFGYYRNVSYKKRGNKIFVPCAMGESEYGYFICGMLESKRCVHPYANVYAVVYNYLLRSSRMRGDDKPKFFKALEMPFEVDYSNVFRIMTVVLQLIKNNYISDSAVNFRYDGDVTELKCALLVLNNYAELFCRLIGLKPCPPLKISDECKAINISFMKKSGVYIENNKIPYNARELWRGQKINYRLTKANIIDLQYILEEISDFHVFRDGQFDALKKMLSFNEHSMCSMPSGKGKSLLFCLASLLQPVPFFVMAPNFEMIREQISNLRSVHNFDNFSFLDFQCETVEFDFSNFEISNSLLFMTYDCFRKSSTGISGGSLAKINGINGINHLSYVVLDERHCLANWKLEMPFEKIGSLVAKAHYEANSDAEGILENRSIGVGYKNLKKLELFCDKNVVNRRYSYSFDLILFLAKLRFEDVFDHERLERIMTKVLKKDFIAFISAVVRIYEFCGNEMRFEIHNSLGLKLQKCGMEYSKLFDLIYLSSKKDLIYYGVLATRLNRQFAPKKHNHLERSS
ncbi:MAG: hypothetical protein FWF76_06160 [Oscillospiraceae bacterium]|nr:hypothetical protein [Oscillospiraceae bacterium]